MGGRGEQCGAGPEGGRRRRSRTVCLGGGGDEDDAIGVTMACSLDKDVMCWQSFYNVHTEKIQRFAIDNPSLTKLESELDKTMTSTLESYTGIPTNCF